VTDAMEPHAVERLADAFIARARRTGDLRGLVLVVEWNDGESVDSRAWHDGGTVFLAGAVRLIEGMLRQAEPKGPLNGDEGRPKG